MSEAEVRRAACSRRGSERTPAAPFPNFRVPLAPQAGSKRLEFAYDYLGRRVQKKVYDWVADPNSPQQGAWAANPSADRRFVYYNWLPVIELDGLAEGSPGVLRKYTWGLDLAGMSGAGLSPAIDAAGGIGGLLLVRDAATGANMIPLFDGNGNVGQLLERGDANDALAARYEYDAYGNNSLDPADPLQSGPYAAANPLRFSTKYWDDETGLGYWGYRYYDPRAGRWGSRDPRQDYLPMRGFPSTIDTGSVSLYEACRNEPITWIDPIGLDSNKGSGSTDADGACVVEVRSGDSSFGSGSAPNGRNFRHGRLKIFVDAEISIVEYGPTGCENTRQEYGEQPTDVIDAKVKRLPKSVCDCIKSAPQKLGLYIAIGDNSNTAAKCVLARCLQKSGQGHRMQEFDIDPKLLLGWDRDCDQIYKAWDRN